MPDISYLDQSKAFWSQGVYDAPNPESFVFRAYGRIFKPDFGLDGSGHEKLLDFGCGPGGNTKFYHDRGFDVYGVDLSEIDIGRCKQRMPKVADHFKVVSALSKRDDRWFGDTKFRIVTAFQSLYLMSEADMHTRLMSLYDMMESGGIIYVSMMAESSWYFGMSVPVGDGLRRVTMARKTDQGREGMAQNDFYMNFTRDEDDLKHKLRMFKPVHTKGYYDMMYRNDEGSERHFLFVGQKA